MQKLKLPVDRLQVDSFEPGAPDDAPGTVNAMAGAAAATETGCNPDFTTVQTRPCCP